MGNSQEAVNVRVAYAHLQFQRILLKFGLAMCKIVLLSLPSGQIGHLAAFLVATVFQLEHEPVKEIALMSLRLIGQIHKPVMRVDHAGHLASIIERILIVRVFLYNKQRLRPHQKVI